MSLNDREHVEAVAIVRRLIETDGHDEEARLAARGWLREHHPTTEQYLAALAEQHPSQSPPTKPGDSP